MVKKEVDHLKRKRMADKIDREVFDKMIEITDPFDPLFAPNIGKSVGRLNKEFENKWIEENVVMGMAPDIATTPIATVKKAMSAIENMAKFQRYVRFNELKKLAKIDFVGETPKVAYKLKEEFHKLQKLVADDTIKAYESLTDAEKAYSRSASPEQMKGLKDVVVKIGKQLVKAKQ